MIHGLYANKQSFHPVQFTTGLNIVLAERTATSTQKDTRNGLGKSTLIEIIDFCLGASSKGLQVETLKDWEFTIEITLRGNRVKVTRALESRSHVLVDGPTYGWIEQPDIDPKSGHHVLSIERWKIVLGWALFGLSHTNDTYKYKPKYRSLISYFVRQGHNAYSDPFSYFRQQKTWDIQTHIAYLLGLSWEYASRWQELKDQEDAVTAMSRAIATGAIERNWGSVGELEAERVQLEEQLIREEVALRDFKVHPQYESVQVEADHLTASIHKLVNDNVAERRLLARYRESIADEKPPSDFALENIYKEAGVSFPDATLRTLKEAREFHQKIILNRKTFLELEVKRLTQNTQDRDREIAEITERRAASLVVLHTYGALQEMTKLQERYVEIKTKLEGVRARIKELKDVASRKREIRAAKTDLAKIAELDHEQRRDVWAKAVRFFNENSQALYKTPGSLVIDITDSGYKYNVEIERSSSEGIAKMKLFCFDLMLFELMRGRSDRIDFLVHDSVLFDGVDSRQRALALERAAQVTGELGGQYICTLNSDMVPRNDFSATFDFDKHVRLVLTDTDPSGQLLGVQFERALR